MHLTLLLNIFLLTTSAAPAAESNAYRMEPVWSLDADQGDEIIFGRIADAVVDGDNTTFVLDGKLSRVVAIDSLGLERGAFGRSGDGPGEFRAPGSLVLLPDGALGVVSRQFSRITKIDQTDGAARGTMVLEGADKPMVSIGRVRAGAGTGSHPELISVIGETLPQTGSKLEYRLRTSLVVYRADVGSTPTPPMRAIMEVGMATGANVEEEDYFRIWDPWTVDRDGDVIVAPYWSDYLIRCVGPSGELRWESRFPFPRRERTPREKQRLLDLLWGGVSPERFGIELELSDTEAVVRSVYSRNSGDCWIRTNMAGSRKDDGVFLVLDVIGPTGEWRGQVEILGPGNEGMDRVCFGSDD